MTRKEKFKKVEELRQEVFEKKLPYYSELTHDFQNHEIHNLGLIINIHTSNNVWEILINKTNTPKGIIDGRVLEDVFHYTVNNNDPDIKYSNTLVYKPDGKWEEHIIRLGKVAEKLKVVADKKIMDEEEENLFCNFGL